MADIEIKNQELVQRQFEEVLTLIQVAHTKVMYAANTTMNRKVSLRRIFGE